MAKHTCPAPRCNRQVPAHQLACRDDWFRLPKALRNRLWAAYYGPGQGSDEHNDVLRECIAWYQANDG